MQLPKKFAPSDVTGITLLSKEEYNAARDIVPLLDDCWWLRSPGDNSDFAAYVSGVSDIGNYVVLTRVSVRPALRLNPEICYLSIGDRIQAAGHTWTVILRNLALCDGSIGEHCFREDWKAPDANDYKASDIKRVIEAWARENGLLPKEIGASDIAGITLLSVEEYLEAKDIVPLLDDCWWLRPPSFDSDYTAYVDYDGSVRGHGVYVGATRVSVRPALRLNPEICHLSIRDRIKAAGQTWTIIPGGLALCDGSIGEHCFRNDWEAPDANDYEASDVKQFIENWARENCRKR